MKPLTIERLRYRWPNGNSALERCSFSIPCPGLWMLVGGNGSVRFGRTESRQKIE